MLDRNKEHTHFIIQYVVIGNIWKKGAQLLPFVVWDTGMALRDDNPLSVENKQPVSKEQECFERNHKPKMESLQKIQLKKQEKEGLITVH